jgi:hypothetical protein
MNTKFKTLAMLFTVAIMAIFTSCEKDDDAYPKPTIGELELGIGNSHVAYIGADLHIETEIVAEGLINTIEVEIHAEDGSDYEIDSLFDYSDQTLKNTTFHKHVDIPAEFPAGEYHFHLTVIDKEGNSTTVEEDIELEELVDEEAPVITISSAPTDAQAFASGETISISGTVVDNTSLAGMVVALVYADDAIADADVAGDNAQVIIMLHTHTFDSETSHSFTASIAVGAEYDNNMTPSVIENDNAWKSGNYYILVKSKDDMGNWAYSNYYPVVINL